MQATADSDSSTALVRNVEYWTIAFGIAGTIGAAIRWRWPVAGGVALGVALALLNYRWLKQGVAALLNASVQQSGAEKVLVPRMIYAKLLGRFALLLLVIYVILLRFRIIAIAVLAGFFALVLGVLAAMIIYLIQNLRQA
jgi:hypothetical protein